MKIMLYTIALLYSVSAIPCEQGKGHEKYTPKDCRAAVAELSTLINDKGYYINYSRNHENFSSIHSKHKKLISSNHETIKICLVYYEPKKLPDIYHYVAMLSHDYENVYSKKSLIENHKYVHKRYTKKHLELIKALETYNKNGHERPAGWTPAAPSPMP